MMARTQITLDRNLLRRAREKASQLGISLAEYLRRLVAADLQGPRPTADPSMVFDLGSSGASNVAADKDRMIGEAIAEDRRRPAR